MNYRSKKQEGGISRVGATPRRTQQAPTLQEMRASLPQKANRLSYIDRKKDPFEVDWEFLLSGVEAGLSQFSNKMEQNRQDEYRYNQMAEMGRSNYEDVEQYQPNPYSLYAKFGGSIKKYQTGGRLVDQVPQGFNKLRQSGDTTFYNKITPVTIPQQSQQQVVTPQSTSIRRPRTQSVYRRPISRPISRPMQSTIPVTQPVTQPMTKTNEDLVYTVNPPTPQQAFKGEPIYEGNKLVGYSRFNSRNSLNQNDPGLLNTANQMSEFMFADDMGKPTGDLYSIPGSEWTNTFLGGTRHLQTRVGLDKYKTPLLTSRKQGGTVDDMARYQIYSKILPQIFKMGSMQRQSRWRGKKGGLTPNKAREILHDGTAQGHPLTDKQRRFFGAISKGHTNFK